mgnify:CR=1 FL=1
MKDRPISDLPPIVFPTSLGEDKDLTADTAVKDREVGEGKERKVEGQYRGLPYKGAPCTIRNDDPKHALPTLKHKAGIKQFNMADPADLKLYTELLQRVCDSEVVLSFEEKVYDPDIKSWRILMRWMEPYYDSPVGKREDF